MGVGLAMLLLLSASCGVDSSTKRIQQPKRRDSESPKEPLRDTPTATPTDQVALAPGFNGIPYDEGLQSELNHLDPLADQWDTEAFNENALAQLKKLARAINQQALGDRAGSLAADGFRSTPLRPTSLQRAYLDSLYSIDRFVAAESSELAFTHSGVGGLSEAIAQLQSELRNPSEVDFHFKIVRVNRLEDRVETEVFVELAAKTNRKIIQQSAEWTCEWTLDKTPQLLTIRIAEFEEVRAAWQLFADDTGTVLGGNESYANQLIFGADHWRESLDWRFGMEIAGPHGLAVADVNGDGLDDVFYCETGGLPNRLFLQLPDGTAQDHSATSGLDYLEPMHSALFVDLDNDGDQDAVLASGRFVLLLQNNGSGQFTRQLIHATSSMTRSMAAADFDSDGDLDIYVCGYFPRDAVGEGVGLGRPMPYHDANNGVQNFLLANKGNWHFEDVTETVGLDVNNRRFSYAASWEDFDNDGDLDLYVANDFGRNNLYRNDGGKFVDVAPQAGVEDMSAGMSVSWGDYDRDGQMDLYVGNMFSSAGNRITYQRRFREEEEPQTRSKYQRHARGNTLFRNSGDGSFEDVSVTADVTMGRWSWSSNFVDINNDGWEDLLVGNGMVTSADDPDDL